MTVYTSTFTYGNCDPEVKVAKNSSDSLKKILQVIEFLNGEGEFDLKGGDTDNGYYTYEELKREIKNRFFMGRNPHDGFDSLYFELIYRDNCVIEFGKQEL